MKISYQPLPEPIVKLSIEGRIILPHAPQTGEPKEQQTESS